MTPERKEEIKRMMEEEYARPDEPYSGRFIANAPQAITELLAALEEAEHLLTDHGPNGRNYTNEQYVTLQQENGALRRGLTKEACTNASHARSLAEAQQTIARQREALEDIKFQAGITGDTLLFYELACEALGEGTKESLPPACPKCNSTNILEHPTKAGFWLCAPCDRVFGEGVKES